MNKNYQLIADEVEEVEQKCQEVIRSIEQAVNEDLQKYFWMDFSFQEKNRSSWRKRRRITQYIKW